VERDQRLFEEIILKFTRRGWVKPRSWLG